MLFQEQAAIDILAVAREFFLNKKLRYVEHHFGTELMKVEKLNYWQRVSCIFPIYKLFQVHFKTLLTFFSVPLGHEECSSWEAW